MQVKFLMFSIEKPTYQEKHSKKYKGGDWYVRRIYIAGNGSGQYPTGIKGLLFSIFSVLIVVGIIFDITRHGQPSALRICLYVGICATCVLVAEIKTYRPRKNAWTQFREARTYYIMRKNKK